MSREVAEAHKKRLLKELKHGYQSRVIGEITNNLHRYEPKDIRNISLEKDWVKQMFVDFIKISSQIERDTYQPLPWMDCVSSFHVEVEK